MKIMIHYEQEGGDDMQNRFKQLRQALNLSQEEFANKLGLTRGAIANIELGRTEAKPLFISLVCKEFNVNEQWLRTGEGEMFNDISREEEITRFVGKLMKDSSDNFKKSLILALSQLPEESWLVLEDFVNRIYDEYRNKDEPK